MGKGRAPCCDKSKVKKGPWSPTEDLRLITFIQKFGHDNWRALPKQAGLLRCGKSCRLRWINYLRPDLKRGNFTKEEEDTIIQLHQSLGNKWSKIASHLPGRTDNEIKNVWNTYLKKKLVSGNSKGNKNCEANEPKKPRISANEKHNVVEELDSNDKQIRGNKKSKESLISSSPSSDRTNSSQVIAGTNREDNALVDSIKQNVPLESDSEFWNMLDSLSSFLSSDDEIQSHDDINGVNSGEVDDGMKWLRLLEKELGPGTKSHENITHYSGIEMFEHENFNQMQLMSPDMESWPYFEPLIN